MSWFTTILALTTPSRKMAAKIKMLSSGAVMQALQALITASHVTGKLGKPIELVRAEKSDPFCLCSRSNFCEHSRASSQTRLLSIVYRFQSLFFVYNPSRAARQASTVVMVTKPCHILGF